MARRILYLILAVHVCLLCQLTSNFHKRRYYGWQNSRWGDKWWNSMQKISQKSIKLIRNTYVWVPCWSSTSHSCNQTRWTAVIRNSIKASGPLSNGRALNVQLSGVQHLLEGKCVWRIGGRGGKVLSNLPPPDLQAWPINAAVHGWLGPNLMIFSFSSGASPAHNAGGRVLPLFSQPIFLTKELDKRGGKMIVAHFRHCRRVLLDAVY